MQPWIVAPRLRAAPSSSRTMKAAPSPREIPCRPRLKGEQGAGSTTRRELKPAKVNSERESAPPQTTDLSRPLAIRSAPQPIEVEEDEQAVVMLPWYPARLWRVAMTVAVRSGSSP